MRKLRRSLSGISMPFTGVVRNYIADRLFGLEEIDWQEKIFGPVREAREKEEEETEKVEDVSRI